MEPLPKPFKRIIAAAEGGSGLVALAAFAAHFAERDAPIRLVDLIADPARLFPGQRLALPDRSDVHKAMAHDAECALRAAIDALKGAPRDMQLLDLSSLRTSAPDALAHAADDFHADLVALAAHRPGHRWACRLEPEEVAYATRRAVLYVPSQLLALDEPPLERALVAVDGSPTSYAALRMALACLPSQVEIRVIYVVDRTLHTGMPFLGQFFERDGQRVLAHVESLAAASGARVSLAMIEAAEEPDDVASAILREASFSQADIAVIGLQGRRARVQALPGSVASRVLRAAQCVVLVAPPVSGK